MGLQFGEQMPSLDLHKEHVRQLEYGDFENLSSKITSEALRMNVEYADVRFYRTDLDLEMALHGSSVQKISESSGVQAGIRTLYDGAWGVASTNNMTTSALMASVRKSVELARALSSRVRMKVLLSKHEPIRQSFDVQVRKDPREASLDEIKKSLLTISTSSPSTEKIVRVASSVSFRAGNKTFADSAGSYMESDWYHSCFGFLATAKEGQNVCSFSDYVAKSMGLEILETEETQKTIEKTATAAVNLLNAKRFSPKRLPVILSPCTAGFLVHEAFGHLAEADIVLGGGTALEGKLGQEIGSEQVTVVDDSTIEHSFGSYPFDDDGVPAQKTVLINKGVLTSFLHSRDTASTFSTESTGNSRATNVDIIPSVRMSNTYITRGNWKLEDILESVKLGVYVKQSNTGNCRLTGDFQLNSSEAYEVRNGEISTPLRGVSLSGNIFETLAKIEAKCNDFVIKGKTCCKMGREMQVGFGGPHIKVGRMLVG